MKTKLTILISIVLSMTLSMSNAFALSSSGSDGAFSLTGTLTLNAKNNQIFNFTTINIQQGGILNFSGLSANDNVFVLATGDIELDGVLNLPANFTFETYGGIYLHGVINQPNSANLSLIANSAFIDGAVNGITFSNGSAGSIDFEIDDFTPRTPISPVPEPSTLLMLLAGITLLGYHKRSIFIN